MQHSVTNKFLSTTFVKTDGFPQRQRTKVGRSEVKTVLGRGVSVMSLHFLYQALSFSFCVLTVSLFSTPESLSRWPRFLKKTGSVCLTVGNLRAEEHASNMASQ